MSSTTPTVDDKKNRNMWWDACRVFTDVEIGAAADFVRKRFVGQNGDLIDEAGFRWARDEVVTEWIDQLVPLYKDARFFDFEEASSSVVVSREMFVDGKVVHLGEDVLALGMTVGIDKDSRSSAVKAIFLRREQRDAARVAVETVFLKEKVCLTGSPGCGKTFATVPAIIADTLLRGLPVLHVSKDLEMQFFMPDGGGGVAAWAVEKSTKVRYWIDSDLANDPRANPALRLFTFSKRENAGDGAIIRLLGPRNPRRRIVVVYDPPKPSPNNSLKIELKDLPGRCIMARIFLLLLFPCIMAQ